MNMRSLICAHRKNPVLRLIALACGKFLRAYDNQFNWDIKSNGERFAVESITKVAPGVVFDVGANVGKYIKECVALPNVTEIHAFELSPPTFKLLSKNIKHHKKVRLNDFGLGKNVGTVEIYHASLSDDRTGLFPVQDGFDREVIKAEIRTGDNYIYDHNIQNVSFLKIDAEGADLYVIQGFVESLKEKKVMAIQFEHGEPCVESRVFLRDIISVLENYGFFVYKLFPNSFERIERYTYELEDFRGRNYVAMLPEVAAKLGYPTTIGYPCTRSQPNNL